MNQDASPQKESRRGFLGLLGIIAVGWLGAAIYPIYRFLSPQPPPKIFGDDGRAAVEGIAPADVANPGTGKNGGYGPRGLIVFRNDSGQLKAFDSKCTHAGCNVAFERTRIFCHCHGGTYDLNGKNIAGPPPKPLTELGVVEDGGQLFVFRKDAPASSES